MGNYFPTVLHTFFTNRKDLEIFYEFFKIFAIFGDSALSMIAGTRGNIIQYKYVLYPSAIFCLETRLLVVSLLANPSAIGCLETRLLVVSLQIHLLLVVWKIVC